MNPKKPAIKTCPVCKKFFSVSGRYGGRRKTCSELCRLSRLSERQRDRKLYSKLDAIKARRLTILWRQSARGKFMSRTYFKRKIAEMTPEQQETIKAQRREYNTMRQREIRKRKAMQQREQAELFILGEFQNNKTVYLFEVANLVFSCEKARTLMEELVKLNVAQLKTDSIWQAGVNFQPYLKQKRKTQYDYGRSRVRSS